MVISGQKKGEIMLGTRLWEKTLKFEPIESSNLVAAPIDGQTGLKSTHRLVPSDMQLLRVDTFERVKPFG